MKHKRSKKNREKRTKRTNGRIREILAVTLAACMVFSLAGCGGTERGSAENFPEETGETEEENLVQNEKIAQNIEIVAGDSVFSAGLYDNETARALAARLPLTLNMSELNGNEKYYYFSDSLPTDPTDQSAIRSGDLMLYGDDCLVLFYEDFSTSYSYTCIGYMQDPSGLEEALGSGDVEVTFRAVS